MSDPAAIRLRIAEAQQVLAELGLPSAQQNEMCALVLLALLGLRSNSSWADASNPLLGIHAMRVFCESEYGRGWAVNTRESVRKNALHYFEAAGVVVANPDDPNRSPNSKYFAYQVPSDLLGVLQSFSGANWAANIGQYVASKGTLVDRLASRRVLASVPLSTMNSTQITLSRGKHSELIEQIVYEFAPRFTPGGSLIYAGDTGSKWGYFDQAALGQLNLTVPGKGTKMPDIIIHHSAENWLVVVEAFFSGGAITPLRKQQLEVLFANSNAPLVFVTAFLNRQSMARQTNKLAWETDVWTADEPEHLIHFNGERFLGPY